MLVFRRGKWHEVVLPFSDPMLTEAHKAAAAALTVNGLVKGASFDVATAAAEKAMYGEILQSNDRRHVGPLSTPKGALSAHDL